MGIITELFSKNKNRGVSPKNPVWKNGKAQLASIDANQYGLSKEATIFIRRVADGCTPHMSATNLSVSIYSTVNEILNAYANGLAEYQLDADPEKVLEEAPKILNAIQILAPSDFYKEVAENCKKVPPNWGKTA